MRAAIEAPDGAAPSPAELRRRIDAVADLILASAGEDALRAARGSDVPEAPTRPPRS